MTVFTRIRAVVGGVAVLGAVVVGCYGGDTAPTAARRADALAVSASKGEWTRPSRGGRDTTVVHFTIDPTISASYKFGADHKLWVRAGGVCELDSPYGPEYWDTPCTPTTKRIAITARSWTDSAGHPAVDFQPKLRFTPQPNGFASAVVYFRDRTAAWDPSAIILYCSGDSCVDEQTTDPLLRTLQDSYDDFIFRQIKHFSGYEVAVGRADTTAVSTSLY